MFASDFDEDLWLENFESLSTEKQLNFFEEDLVSDWRIISEADKSFYKNLYEIAKSEGEVASFKSWFNCVIDSMEEFIKNDTYLMETMDEEDMRTLKTGEVATNIEIMAAAEVTMWEIQLYELDENCFEKSSITFRPQNIIKTIYIAKNDDFFASKLV